MNKNPSEKLLEGGDQAKKPEAPKKLIPQKLENHEL